MRSSQRNSVRLGTAVAALCLAACAPEADADAPSGPSGEAPTAPAPAPPTPEPDGEGEIRTVTVEMRGIAFNAPGGGDLVTIGLGGRIRWVNLDGTDHTVTSSSVPEGGKGFSSGRILPGGEYFFRPNVTGTWIYYCQQYPDRMALARINVVP